MHSSSPTRLLRSSPQRLAHHYNGSGSGSGGGGGLASGAPVDMLARVQSVEALARSCHSRSALVARELERLRPALDQCSSQVKGHAEGIGLLLQVVDTSVSKQQLAEAEARLEQKLNQRLREMERSQQAAAVRGEALTERVRAAEQEARHRREQYGAMEEQVASLVQTAALLRTNAEQSDRIVELRLEQDLQAFARSFRQAVVRMDEVVQGLDRKMTESITILSDRTEAAAVSRFQSVDGLTERANKVLEQVSARTLTAEKELVRLAEHLGHDQQSLHERLATQTEEQLHELARTTSLEIQSQVAEQVSTAWQSSEKQTTAQWRLRMEQLDANVEQKLREIDSRIRDGLSNHRPGAGDDLLSGSNSGAVVSAPEPAPALGGPAPASHQPATQSPRGRRTIVRKDSQASISMGAQSKPSSLAQQQPQQQPQPSPRGGGRRSMARRESQASIS
jgi:hypothetical protein